MNTGSADRDKLPERFWSKVTIPADAGQCWEWTAATNSKGYGLYSLSGRAQLAHRVAYTALVNPIPVGMVIDHTCRNRRCVNPNHLEPVTSRENTRRGHSALVTHLRFRNTRKAVAR